MTENNSTNEDDAERYSPREMTLTIGGEELPLSGVEWDGVDDQLDSPDFGLRGNTLHEALNGTLSFGGEVDEIEANVTITDSEGNKHRIEKATIKSREKVREEARELRKNAPLEYDLGDRTADIDDIIRALQQAKGRGVREVYVNDDGMTRSPDPRITNNHVHYYGNGPEPDGFNEWLEL